MLLVLVIVAVCIALDQVTKALAQAYLPPHTIHLLGGTVRLALSENAGAFLSLGAALPPALRFWIFTVASAAMLVGVVAYAVTSSEIPGDVVIALACVAGGGVGNLIDRITRDGHVIDFLNFGIGNLRTGILNVADIFITFGALYVMWAALRSGIGEATAHEAQGE
jgi:signal peptidase II